MPDFGGGDFEPFVVGVLPSRQLCVVRISGGFTPGYRDTVFQTGGAGVLSGYAFHTLVMEVLPSRQQGVACWSGGFTPGYRDTVFQTGGASVLFVHAFRIPSC